MASTQATVTGKASQPVTPEMPPLPSAPIDIESQFRAAEKAIGDAKIFVLRNFPDLPVFGKGIGAEVLAIFLCEAIRSKHPLPDATLVLEKEKYPQQISWLKRKLEGTTNIADTLDVDGVLGISLGADTLAKIVAKLPAAAKILGQSAKSIEIKTIAAPRSQLPLLGPETQLFSEALRKAPAIPNVLKLFVNSAARIGGKVSEVNLELDSADVNRLLGSILSAAEKATPKADPDATTAEIAERKATYQARAEQVIKQFFSFGPEAEISFKNGERISLVNATEMKLTDYALGYVRGELARFKVYESLF